MTALLREQLAGALQRHPEQEMVLDGERISYAEMERMASLTAGALRDRGVRPGDIVMTVCENGASIVATWWACLRLAAVFAPLHARLEGDALAHTLRHAGGAILVCDVRRWEAVLGVAPYVPALRRVLVSRGAAVNAPTGLTGESFEDAVAAALAAPKSPADETSPARLLFTSGTTGESKAVLWSRLAETVHATKYGEELVKVPAGETVYSCLPLYHVTCQGTLLGSILAGARVVIDRRFEPLRFWRRTAEEDAVFFPYVGTMITTLLSRAPGPHDAANPVRRAMGSAAPAARWQEFEERFGVEIDDVWGQTETASCWTVPAVGAARYGNVGHPSPRFAARLVGSDGELTTQGAPGELWIRPRHPQLIFDGYRSHDGSLERATDADGWYHTGDLLSGEADGRLCFHGRLREAIRRRGEMISPAMIEAIALRHPGVLEAAAVGVPADDGVEDEIMLWAVRTAGVRLSERELLAHLHEGLPQYMVPRYVRFADSLPKTPSTRIQRSALRARGVAGAWDARTRTALTDG